jgi:hypothetical protein
VARKGPADPPSKVPAAIILQFEPRKYAVAVWRRDEDGVPVYEIVQENIRDARVAVTLAREAGKPRRAEAP